MKRIVIINGPNLDRLGLREPGIYGSQTLTDLENLLTAEAAELGVQVQFYQSNHEGFIIDEINHAYADGKVFGLIINPGALTHTSLALRDCLAGSGLPVIGCTSATSISAKNPSAFDDGGNLNRRHLRAWVQRLCCGAAPLGGHGLSGGAATAAPRAGVWPALADRQNGSVTGSTDLTEGAFKQFALLRLQLLDAFLNRSRGNHSIDKDAFR